MPTSVLNTMTPFSNGVINEINHDSRDKIGFHGITLGPADHEHVQNDPDVDPKDLGASRI